MAPTTHDDLEWSETEHGETNFRRKTLAAAAGGETLGCSLYELPAGAKSWTTGRERSRTRNLTRGPRANGLLSVRSNPEI